MKAAFPEKDVAYGLLRQSFVWESVGDVSADTVKFVFVYWFPDSSVPLMRKMKVGELCGFSGCDEGKACPRPLLHGEEALFKLTG